MYMYVFAFFVLILFAYIINKIISYAKLVHYSSAKNLDYGYLVSHDKEGVREKRLTKETIEMISSAIAMPLDTELYLKNGFTNFKLPYSVKNIKDPSVFIKLIDYNGKELFQVDLVDNRMPLAKNKINVYAIEPRQLAAFWNSL